jgi:EcsC protein family
MQAYEVQALQELKSWQKKMTRKPGLLNRLSKKMQTKLNSYIPDKVHQAITTTIKQMIRGVLFGATYTTRSTTAFTSLEVAEATVKEKISFYKKTAATEGGITGAGGLLLAVADFPLLLSIKLKMLFDIASAYGFNVKDYRERLYILHIFQLAFSSQKHRKEVYGLITNWDEKSKLIPEDIHQFDWQSFQQEYRDYIDLAKLAQLIPGIGAVVGVVVNYRLLNQLGETAMNAYRMRLQEMKAIGV